MKLYYVSTTTDAESFAQLFRNSAKVPGQQAQKFHRLMLSGLARNGAEVTAVSGLPVTKRNMPRKLIRGYRKVTDGVTYRYVFTVNLPFLKNITQMIGVFIRTLFGCVHKDSAVVCDVLNASIAYAAMVAARLAHKPCIGIVTDLPELMVTGTGKRYCKMVHRVIDGCTGYVMLTAAMNEALNEAGKPCTIIEGLCDISMHGERRLNESVRVAMYAGLLDSRYGVKTMVDGFVKAAIPNAQLHIYGAGPYVSTLKRVVAENPNVVYHGTVMVDEVVAAELEADLLINPRPACEEFAKFSFPSKNMEYMVSGTPLLGARLPGIPEEYYSHMYLIADDTVEGMAAALRETLMLPSDELSEKGASAKRFVLEEKNNIKQAARLLSLLD